MDSTLDASFISISKSVKILITCHILRTTRVTRTKYSPGTLGPLSWHAGYANLSLKAHWHADPSKELRLCCVPGILN